MKLLDRLFISFAKMLPKGYRRSFEQLMIYAGLKQGADVLVGRGVFLGLLATTIVLLMPKAVFGEQKFEYIIFAVIVFGLIQFFTYIGIYFKVEQRTKRVEDALPDAFQIVAANLRSGMTPFKALKLASRKEFGPLAEELNHATSKALGIGSFSDALLRTSERIRSELLDRSLKLFSAAIRSGGHLAPLLEELAADISETQALRKEVRTSTKTYSAFIMFTIVIGTPLLLAISIKFVDMISNMQTKTATQTVGFGMGFLVGEVVLTADFLTKMSMVIILMTCVLASMLLGVINDGKAKSGFKYAPSLLAGCTIVFVIANYFVGKFIVGLA